MIIENCLISSSNNDKIETEIFDDSFDESFN